VFVPELAEPSQRTEDGVYLQADGTLGPTVEVYLGKPVPTSGDSDQLKLMNAATEFLGNCGSAGTPTVVNGHPARSGYPASCWRGRGSSGSLMFVLRDDDNAIPLACFYPQAKGYVRMRISRREQERRDNEDAHRQGSQSACEVVLASVMFTSKDFRPATSTTHGKRVQTAGLAPLTTLVPSGQGRDEYLVPVPLAPKPGPEDIPVLPARSATQDSADGSLAAAAAASLRRKQESGTAELTTLDRAPAGYRRWERSFCEGGFCYDLSIAVPQSTKAAASSARTTLLFGQVSSDTITIAVGPPVECPYPGLTEREQLHRAAMQYLGNPLWFSAGNGKLLLREETVLEDRTAEVIDFETRGRDRSLMRGRVAFVMGPNSTMVGVACAYRLADLERAAQVCRAVADSVKIHYADNAGTPEAPEDFERSEHPEVPDDPEE
jgi:hypothetical protein